MDAIQKYPWGKGTPKWSINTTANDSDKTILTVPTGKLIEPCFVVAGIKTTATVGNRKFTCVVSDGTGIIVSYLVAVTAENKQTIQLWVFGNYTQIGNNPNSAMAWIYDGTITNGAGQTMSYPKMILPAGYTIRVYDIVAVDAAADDMWTTLHYIEYDA